MASYLTFLVLLCIAATALAKSPFIVGGQDTTIEQYPSLVQIEFSLWPGYWDQMCAGNILTTYWILSAAHCFALNWYDRRNSRIRAGSTYRNVGGSVHYFDYEINHPEFSRAATFDADISVVKLLTPVVYSPSIQKATIIPQGFVIPDNFPVVHAGWGTLEYKGQSSFILQDVSVNVINREICAQRHGSATITGNMICAGVLDVGGRDACEGDSGGPLYAQDIIIGIVSFGSGCANGYFPGVSTKVASYTDWIVANAR